MSLKKTLLIALVFGLLVTYYLWDHRRIERVEVQKKIAGRLVRSRMEDWTAIRLFGEPQEIALVKQADGFWRIIEPVVARTDLAAIEWLLRTIDHSRKNDPFVFEPGNLQEYGLDPPMISIEITSLMGETQESLTSHIEVGGQTPSGREIYARVGGAAEIFTAQKSLRDELSKSLGDLRDKRLLPADLTRATTLTLTFDGREFEIEKRDDRWMLNRPIAAKADGGRIKEMLRGLNNARASDFVDSPTLSQASLLEATSLKKPQWVATVFVENDQGEPTSMTLRVGSTGAGAPSPEKRWAWAEGEPGPFAIDAGVLQMLLPSLNDLRAKELFTLGLEQIGRVRFNVRDKVIELVLDGEGVWRYVDEPETPLDQGAVVRKLSKLVALTAAVYIDEPTTAIESGLDRPNLRITIASQDGATTEGLITGRINAEHTFVYGRRLDTGEAIGLNLKDPGNFFLIHDELLDKSLFTFNADHVVRIEIIDEGKKATFSLGDDNSWSVASAGAPDVRRGIERQAMTNLLACATGLDWSRRLSPEREGDSQLIQTKRLDTPPREVVFYDESGAEMGRLGQGGEDERYVYVRRDAAHYFSIDKMRMNIMKEAIAEILEALDK